MQESTLLIAPEPPTTTPRAQPAQRQRILVVEDHSIIRYLNTETLQDAGYQVDAAADGAAAWDLLNARSYDLMVTDHSMPKVTGVELLKLVHDAGITVPVIMASGTMPEGEFIRHPAIRPAATLLKPYDLDELLEMVTRVLHATAQALVPVAARPQWRRASSGEGWQLA